MALTKKRTLIVFGYEDGSYEYAVGEHAEEVSQFLDAAQCMFCIHGAEYKGRVMTEVPAPDTDDLEPIRSIAERTLPEWVAELRETSNVG